MSKAVPPHSPILPSRARNARPVAVFCQHLPRLPEYSIVLHISGRTLGVECKQSPLGDQQIRQSEQREELRRVLGKSFVAQILHAEEVLDDVELMLNLGTRTRLELFHLFLQATNRGIRQRLALTRTHCNFPLQSTATVLSPFIDTLIACIAEGSLFLAMQERMGLGDIVGVRRGSDQGMSNSRFGIDANVGLHAEVLLVTHLGLMHVRITLAALILGGGRRGDHRRINHSAFLEDQPFHRQQCVDGREDPLGQFVLFEQAAELEQGRRMRCRHARQVDADKTANCLAVVDGIFSTLIREPEALLGVVHPEHAFYANRRQAASLAFGVVRLYLGYQGRPRRHRIDLAEKSVATRHLLLGRVLKVRKTRLHRQVPINLQYLQCLDSRRHQITKINQPSNKSALR